jgi:hypothetical protein
MRCHSVGCGGDTNAVANAIGYAKSKRFPYEESSIPFAPDMSALAGTAATDRQVAA